MKIAIIGVGAMGGAIARGLSSTSDGDQIVVRDHHQEKVLALATECGAKEATDGDLVTADFIIVAVKPPVVAEVLAQIKNLGGKATIVSIAAGISLASLQVNLETTRNLVRVMPNTPLAIGEGMIAIAKSEKTPVEIAEKVQSLFQRLGSAVLVNEQQLEALGALSGAGPGYIYVILDALADAGVRIGLPRNMAIQAVAQTMVGAARMQLLTGRHPAVLRDEVTSPGGTTIAGIHAMERGGVRAALLDAVTACYQRACQMEKKHE